MSEPQVFPVPDAWAARTEVGEKAYAKMRADAKADPAAFFGAAAKDRLAWIKPFTIAKDASFNAKDLHIRWFADGCAERLGQLHRPVSGRARRSSGDHLGGRRSGGRPTDHLSPAT